MIAESDIQAFIDSLVKKYNPIKVLLFGSYAKGEATDLSDVDILVEIETYIPSIVLAKHMLDDFQPAFSVDLRVYRPDEIKERLLVRDEFLIQVFSEGLVKYGI